MAVRRPPQAPPGTSVPDVELMEHLVKKSLDINPQMRGGKSTHEVMEDLRKEAIARSKTAGVGTAPPSGAAKASLSERRRATIAFFFEQKSAQMQTVLADLRARERALADEKRVIQKQLVDEIVDFIHMVSSGAEVPELRGVLLAHRGLLAELNVSEADLIRLAKGRG